VLVGTPLETTPTSWACCKDDRTIVTGAGVRDCDIIGKVPPPERDRFCMPEASGTVGLATPPGPELVRCGPVAADWECMAMPVGAVRG